RVAEAAAKQAADAAETAKLAAVRVRDQAITARDEATRLAAVQEYRALTNRLRATLTDRGAYAAWRELQQVAPERLEALLEHQGPEWAVIARQLDWQAEATERFAGLDAPLVASSSDGSIVAVVASGADGGATASLYRDGDFDRPAATIALASPPTMVLLSPDGGTLAAIDGASRRPWLFRTSDGERFTIADADADTAAAVGRITSAAFGPAGARLLTGDAATGVATWTLDPAAASATLAGASTAWHQQPVSAVGFAADGSWSFSADTGGAVNLWKGGSLDQAPVAYRHSDQSTTVAHITTAALSATAEPSADGSADGPRRVRLAYGSTDGSVHVASFTEADAERFAESRFVSFRYREDTPTSFQVKPERLAGLHPAGVTAVAFADGGELVVSAGGPTLLVRAAQPGAGQPGATVRRKRERSYHASPVRSLALAAAAENADADAIAADVITADADGRVVQWSTATAADGVRLNAAPGESRGGVAAIGVDRRSGAIAVGDRQGFVRQWDTPFDSGEYTRRFAGHADHRRMQAWRLTGAEPR
ncbi:MAG: WD40 repeat domain-containing protein, partial [Planctomycetota bacterium]